jgi:hypothetical protein
MTKQQLSASKRIGGQTLLKERGRDYYSRIGSKGGRPRNKTLLELQQELKTG